MLRLSFNQSKSELMVRAAATILFNALERQSVEQVNVGELAERPQYGFTASATIAPVGPKLVRITDLQDGRISWGSVPHCECAKPDNYLLQEDDILFARTGATTGKTHLVRSPERAVFASYLIRLRPKPGVDPGYLYAFFQSDGYWEQISKEKEGSAQPNVNGEKLSSLRLPRVGSKLQRAIAEFVSCVRQRQGGASVPLPILPEPLAEQRWTVTRIEELANNVEQAAALRRQSDDEVQAFVGAVASKLFHQFTDTKKIEEIGEVRGGIQKGPHRTPGANPVRYLTVAHVQRNKILTDDPRFFEVTPEELERWRLMSGDVLIIEGNGSADQIGRTALFRGEVDDCVHQNHVIRIRPNHKWMVPEFLNCFLNSSAGQDAVQSQSRTTSGLRTLSVGRIKAIPVPVPSLKQQHRTVNQLADLDQRANILKKAVGGTSQELAALMPSILDKAFRGEL